MCFPGYVATLPLLSDLAGRDLGHGGCPSKTRGDNMGPDGVKSLKRPTNQSKRPHNAGGAPAFEEIGRADWES